MSLATQTPAHHPDPVTEKFVPTAGDILYFHQYESYAQLSQDETHIIWAELEPPNPPTVADLDAHIDNGNCTVVAEDFSLEEWEAQFDHVEPSRETDSALYELPSDSDQQQLHPQNAVGEMVATDGKSAQKSLPGSIEPREDEETTPAKYPCDPSLVETGGWHGHPTDLRTQCERGEGSIKRINALLKDDAINYAHRPISKKKAGLSLKRPNSDIDVGIATLGRPGREIDDGSRIVLDRLATHPNTRVGTESFLINKTAQMAYLLGFDRYITYAGVADNEGTVYQSLGLSQINREYINNEGYANRKGRQETEAYVRRKYAADLVDHPLSGRRPKALSGPLSTEVTKEAYPSGVGEYLFVREDDDRPNKPALSHKNCSIRPFLEAHSNSPVPHESDIVAVYSARYPYEQADGTYTADPVASITITEAQSGSGEDTAKIAQIATCDDVDYPYNILRWLLAKVGHWAHLWGYDSLTGTSTTTLEKDVFAGTQFRPIQSGSQRPTTWMNTTAHFQYNHRVNFNIKAEEPVVTTLGDF